MQARWVVLVGLLACDNQTLEPTSLDAATDITTATVATYHAVQLGSLGGIRGAATAMLGGRIVGNSETIEGGSRAFLWQNGVMHDLGALFDPSPEEGWITGSWATDINNKGQIVGYSSVGLGPHAALWQNGEIRDLGTLGGYASRAAAINSSGVIVGYAVNAVGNARAVRWQNGVIHSLGTLGGALSFASDINSKGQIVGYSDNKVGISRAFVWQNDIMRDLGGLSDEFTYAKAINAAGQIVGWSRVNSELFGPVHAVLWSASGQITDLGTLPGDTESEATDIDDLGRVTGVSRVQAFGNGRVFVWENGKMRSLGYTAGKPNSTLGISPNGNLVGSSTNAAGINVATLWKRDK